MKRKWIITASTLILIGFIGLLFSGFKINDKELIEFEHEFEYSGPISLNDLTILGSSTNVNLTFLESDVTTQIIKIDGKTDIKTIEKIRQANFIDGHFKLDLGEEEAFRLLSFGFQESKININVFMPKPDKLSQLVFNLKSGNIEINQLAAKSGLVEVKSGKIQMNNSEVDELQVKATSGNIKVTEQKGNLAVKIGSGNVSINQLTGYTSIDSTSGEINVTQHDKQGASIKAKSGNVKFVQHKASNVDIDVLSGNVKFEAANDFAGFYELKTTSGNIDSPDSKRSSQHLIKINTTSGDIKVTQ